MLFTISHIRSQLVQVIEKSFQTQIYSLSTFILIRKFSPFVRNTETEDWRLIFFLVFLKQNASKSQVISYRFQCIRKNKYFVWNKSVISQCYRKFSYMTTVPRSRRITCGRTQIVADTCRAVWATVLQRQTSRRFNFCTVVSVTSLINNKFSIISIQPFELGCPK